MGDKYKERTIKSIYFTFKQYRYTALNTNNTLVTWCADAKKIFSPLINVNIPNITCKNTKKANIDNGLYKDKILFLIIYINKNKKYKIIK